MKKKLIFSAMLICLLALGFIFTGCGDDGNNSSNGGVTATLAKEEGYSVTITLPSDLLWSTYTVSGYMVGTDLLDISNTLDTGPNYANTTTTGMGTNVLTVSWLYAVESGTVAWKSNAKGHVASFISGYDVNKTVNTAGGPINLP